MSKIKSERQSHSLVKNKKIKIKIKRQNVRKLKRIAFPKTSLTKGMTFFWSRLNFYKIMKLELLYRCFYFWFNP